MIESVTKYQDGQTPHMMREESIDSAAEINLSFLKEKKNRPKITDFELGEIIGIGNFGKVYKAWNKKTEKFVALKALIKEGVAGMKHVDHVINEREILFYLNEVNQRVRR
jgi:serine/threonine protein kinase